MTADPADTSVEGVMALAAPQGCQLWLLDLRTPLDPRQWQACSEDEHARAGRLRFERDAHRYRCAHALMRQVLARQFGMPPDALRWRVGSHGKPHLLHPMGLHFNLSHSGDWALLGVSESERIGVDIECHQPRIDVAELAQHHFNAEEQQALARCSQQERDTFFFRTWVAKEAAMKALGCGLILRLADIAGPWQLAWTPIRAQWRNSALPLRVHGLLLPDNTGSQVQAAVALWQPAGDLTTGALHEDHEGPENHEIWAW